MLEAAKLGHSAKERGAKGRKESKRNEHRGVKGSWRDPPSPLHIPRSKPAEAPGCNAAALGANEAVIRDSY